jgi:hypothetical protein
MFCTLVPVPVTLMILAFVSIPAFATSVCQRGATGPACDIGRSALLILLLFDFAACTPGSLRDLNCQVQNRSLLCNGPSKLTHLPCDVDRGITGMFAVCVATAFSPCLVRLFPSQR